MRYILLSKNQMLLEFNLKGTLVDELRMLGHKELLPEILKSGKEAALQHWLGTRGIDTTRTNARVLLNELKLKSDRVSAVVFNKGLNMTDCYWIKDTQKDGDMTFEDVSLYRKINIKSISALSISGRAARVPTSINHEVTNIGSFNRAWIKEDGAWWLYKTGSIYNNYAELFTFYLGKHLGMDMAIYKYAVNPEVNAKEHLIASLNFTSEDYMLEHYDSFRYRFEDVGLEDDEVIINNLREVGLNGAYENMLMLDALVANTDRHEFNFGVLKKVDTGEVVRFAPCFDHNLALNAHLNNGEPIGLGLYKLCKRTVGTARMKAFLKEMSIEDIYEIDKRARENLRTDVEFKFVIDYFKNILQDLKNSDH